MTFKGQFLTVTESESSIMINSVNLYCYDFNHHVGLNQCHK